MVVLGLKAPSDLKKVAAMMVSSPAYVVLVEADFGVRLCEGCYLKPLYIDDDILFSTTRSHIGRVYDR